MRVLQEPCFTVAVRDVGGNASTSIDNTQTKPKRRPKKYRAVERPDGIIVEHPRYRPTAPSRNGIPKPNHIVVVPRIYTKQAGGVKSSRMVYELLGIGISETNFGGGNYGESTDETRGVGQGSVQYQQIHIEVEKYTVERQNRIERNAMDRFLHDGGPWSPYSQRETD